jgi:hypothetical protein
MAEHRFVFVAKSDDAVEVQSIESWHGIIARLLKIGIAPAADRVGNEQLDALVAAVVKT